MKEILSLVLLFSSLQALSIENGVLASKKQLFDFGTVAIIFEYDGKEESVCTGTRIAPRVILTAWHCINSFDVFPKGVRQALDPLDKHVEIEKIKAITFPGLTEDFFNNYLFQSFFGNVHDIALVILEKQVSASILRISDSIPDEENFIQLGFGMDFHESRRNSYPLSILDNGVLQASPNAKSMIGIINENSSVRDGDSGGALISRDKNIFYILGVLSDADPNPLDEIKDGKSNYTDIRYFSRWINSVTKPGVQDIEGVQYPLEKNIFLTAKNIKSTYIQLCNNMNKTHGSRWVLNDEGDCLPTDEYTCNKMSSHIFPVVWDSKAMKCVYY